MKKKYINKISKQLKQSENFEVVKSDKFDDNSASWIECYKNTSPDKNGNRQVIVLSFDGDGNTLNDIEVFQETLQWSEDSKKIL